MSLRPTQVNFEETWARIEKDCHSVMIQSAEEAKKVSASNLVSDVYKLCTAHPQHFAEQTYEKIKGFLEAHAADIRQKIEDLQSGLLSAYLGNWKKYMQGVQFILHISKYLNDNWIKRTTEEKRGSLGSVLNTNGAPAVYDIFTLALVVWRDHLFQQVKPRLVHNLLSVVKRERDGDDVTGPERSVLPGVIGSIVTLGHQKHKSLDLYRESFEIDYINATNEYYSREAAMFIAQNSVFDYMKKAEKRILEEEARAKALLDSSSFERVKTEVEKVLISQHMEKLQAEVEPMIREEKIPDLGRMYFLMKRVPDGINPMLESLREYVVQTGLSRLRGLGESALQKPKQFVEMFFELDKNFRNIVNVAFNHDPLFVAALDRGMKAVVNDTTVFRQCKSSELLAKYCDLLLKKGKDNLEDAALNTVLDDVLSIFRFIEDKDIFQKFYSRNLAKRLIGQTSVSEDAESGMLSRLRQAVGYEYTSKLNRMFTDISLSEDVNKRYVEYRQSNSVDLDGIEFSIQVLQAGSWPYNQVQSQFSIPVELEKCLTAFEVYYQKMSTGRKLHWMHNQSKGELKTNYLGKGKEKEFQLTTHQMAILLLFNRNEQMTLTQFTESCQLKDKALCGTVAALVEGEILRTTSTSKPEQADYRATDVFTLNMEYTNKRHKIKVAAVALEAKEENVATQKAVDEDRKLFMQAVIVRVMKMRKALNHNQLISEVVAQCQERFTASIPLIKKCIETLIEKAYLERDEVDKALYKYLA